MKQQDSKRIPCTTLGSRTKTVVPCNPRLTRARRIHNRFELNLSRFLEKNPLAHRNRIPLLYLSVYLEGKQLSAPKDYSPVGGKRGRKGTSSSLSRCSFNRCTSLLCRAQTSAIVPPRFVRARG